MQKTKPMPSQAECNPGDPEEHFLWALRNMPAFAGSGVITHSGFLRKWSKHLWEAGFAHRDYLASLADENGNIHVSKLPEQQIKFQEAFRGPQHQYNGAARWVRADEPEPEVTVIPDIRQMTQQENWALAYQLQAAGYKIPDPPQPSKARVFEESEVSHEQ
ncbi:phage gene 29 protein family protein [Mycobacterium intracellulare]|uniref:Minor tail protein n=1 Tax=Mycobacterium intracellulare TaxID=1767 RepID=A0A7R7RSN8_MYCIT|nr:DUF2744 domain-containing protein [Mycobacterium intracellulare]BCP02531.1 hypothetical protein MINTM018_53000 [Mycobacterium intracellulare]BCP36356.1 hypothetical protein MINTMi198_17260 [Mycobacterium intracellulare M.i.198]